MTSVITRAILRVILPYVALSALWILLSDQMLGYLPLDAASITQWSIYKGLAFVLVTALLLSALLRKELNARERDQAALHVSEERFRVLGDNLPDSYVYQYTLADDGTPKFIYISTGVERLHGVKAEDVLRDARLLQQQVAPELRPALKEAEAFSRRTLSDFMMELRFRHADGQWRWLQLCSRPRRTPDGQVVWDGAVRDITERTLTEQEREATIEFLKLLQESSGTADLVHRSIAFFRRQSLCDAAGIRLHDGEDYPYFETCGFPPGFVQLESSLCQRDQTGRLVLDSVGNPAIACMCGNVICGRFDPTKPFFTAHGSFWTNCTSELLASTTEADRQARTRNRCNGEGYESVALLPLRVGDERLGLLQLNSRAQGAFSPHSIELWERLSGYLAVALSHFRAQEALRASEETYRSLFENMLNGFACCRMLFQDGQPCDFVFLRVNRAFETHSGLKDVTGKRVSEVIPGILESDADLIALYGHVAATGKPEVFERYVHALDMWFHVSVYCPLKDHFVIVFDTITERKRAEEALRESEKRLRTLGDNLPGGMLYQLMAPPNGQNHYTYVSAGVEAMFGMPAESVMANPASFWQLIVEEDRAHIDAEQALSAREMSLFDCDFRQRTRSGEVRWFHARSTPRRIKDGSILWDGVVTDITASKLTEEALRESQNRFRSLIESAPDAIFVQSQGRFTYLNPAMLKMFGASCPMQLIGTEFIERIAPEFHEAVRRRILEQRDSGKSVSLMAQEYLRLDGTRVPVETTAVAIRFQDRDAHLVFVRDITARKRADVERERMGAQLQQAQKMESVGRLAGGVAHDFNNMLSVILGGVEMAMEKVSPAQPLFADLQEIRKAAERSAELTRQLLAFARKQAVTPQALDLNQAVASALKMLRLLIGEDIEISWLPGAEDATVMADPSQLDLLLANLTVNARDAIAGVGKLTLKTETIRFTLDDDADNTDAVPPGDYVMLSVSDNGCGMDRATLDHIFEPFFTTKGVGEGTGLGLATAYGIVQQNRGFIFVSSEVGQGTTFRIYLPRHLDTKVLPQSAGPSAVTCRGHETILLVEDEPSILNMCERMLASLGYRVHAANTPKQAIELAAKHAGGIQLLLTDMVMPEMNGRDLAKHLRSLYPDIKLLFMSGYMADVIVHQELLAAGITFIQKPFTVRELAAKMAAALERG